MRRDHASSTIAIRRPAATLRVRCADTWLRRALGLLATARLADDAGLLIVPCHSIHTFGMRYAIDAVFLDAAANVLAVRPQLPPWRLAACWRARAVLELPAGAAARAGLHAGQHLPELRPWLALP